jgi:hypothetical protein
MSAHVDHKAIRTFDWDQIEENALADQGTYEYHRLYQRPNGSWTLDTSEVFDNLAAALDAENHGKRDALTIRMLDFTTVVFDQADHTVHALTTLEDFAN